jgi:hypothetical protein
MEGHEDYTPTELAAARALREYAERYPLDVAVTPDGDAPCGYSWPDRNSVRVHVCIGVGEHEHSCGVCGPSVIPPVV